MDIGPNRSLDARRFIRDKMGGQDKSAKVEERMVVMSMV